MAIETNEMIDIQELPPFKKFIMTIGNIPTSYLESMTYAELVMWFCDYLQNTVIPTVNNNADALQEVITYLKTLDLQDEVNTKLDEMAESGELLQVLANFMDFVTPEMFGAKGDGVTDDTEAFQTMLESSDNLLVHSDNSKVYIINEKLDIKPTQELDLGNATLKTTNSELDYLLNIHTSNDKGKIIHNLVIDCNNLCGGIYVEYGDTFTLEHITIKNFATVGLYIKQGNVVAKNLNLNNDIDNNAIGIKIEGTDSKFYDVTVRNAKIGVENDNGINYFNGVHVWLGNIMTIYGSIGFLVKGQTSLDNCYIDTYHKAIVNDNGNLLLINNLKVYINPTIYNAHSTAAPVFIDFTQNNSLYPNGAYLTYLYSFNLIMTSNYTPLFSSSDLNDIMRYLPLKTISHNRTPFNLVDYYQTELDVTSTKFNVSRNILRLYDNKLFIDLQLTAKSAELANITAGTREVIGTFPSTIPNKIEWSYGVVPMLDQNGSNLQSFVSLAFIKKAATNSLNISYHETPRAYGVRISKEISF